MEGLRLGLWMRYWAGFRLAPFVPTPFHVAHRMLDLASVKPSDFVMDLGCGDGRLLITAAKKYGAKGFGVELDPHLFREAQKAIRREGLCHMISVQLQDALQVDLTRATVVTLYLSEKGNDQLLPKLQCELGNGARVVSFCWPFSKLDPSLVKRVDGINLYLYEMLNDK
ncbi:hypothetical protein O6H91_16G018600 [Diphasiastrum complanatum]|uniref:Uncharacterized protein n=1 Tax=Diphasiastrum complanatum TaxID=34168 RepID=A0ACC2BBA4_DIPCM|nr:hypothetical protein O6H91_16G018600 [Diphasiastrum complanatum]